MCSIPADSEIITDKRDEEKIEKSSISANYSRAFKLEIDIKNTENKELCEKLTQSKLTIEHLEKLISSTASQMAQLTMELVKAKNELRDQQQKANWQNEYHQKEIDNLKAESEYLKTVLKSRQNRLEKANNKIDVLQSEIASNRYKIFCINFNGLEEEEDSENESTITSHETSETTEIEETEVAEDTENTETTNITETSKTTTSDLHETYTES